MEKGDADSSSEGEDSEEEEEALAQKQRKLKNLKIKKDLKNEQEELGKIVMSKKQRRLFEQADRSQ